MRIAIAGTGYVGLVTGVCLADIGHDVACYDIDRLKVKQLKQGKSPFYEPEVPNLLKKNVAAGRLIFTDLPEEAYRQAEVIYIAVPTPQAADGSADLSYLFRAAEQIARSVMNNVVVVVKSTVPVGTNEKISELLNGQLKDRGLKAEVVSNPEFLREGSAVHDMFHGERIIIGAESEQAADVVASINKPFGIPILRTDLRSAEMTKYASNAFLAAKVSFINEIASICEKLGADIESVAAGMGMDKRIGDQFLRAGIGYGGSCFPKDTRALVQIAGNSDHKFELLESVIKVNNRQQSVLFDKAKGRFEHLKGKKAAVLGLSFKPNTDDIREAASMVLIDMLLFEEVDVIAYDPAAIPKTKEILGNRINYAKSGEEALQDTDMAFLVTEWEEIKDISFDNYAALMKTPVIFDGRNCHSLEEAAKHPVEYYSIGRRPVVNVTENTF